MSDDNDTTEINDSPGGGKPDRVCGAVNYTYTVAPDWASRPVNEVGWGDAARFADWLHNGQPTGMQDLTTTEDDSSDFTLFEACFTGP